MGKKKCCAGFIVVIIQISTLFDPLLYAQEVPHYDFLVNTDDPKACLGCHDGTVGMNIPFCTGITGCLLDQETSHPVFKKYPPAGKEVDFAPVSELEAAGIRLIDGEVTCVSCHNLINQNRYHLVMENHRSRLCRSCHLR